MDNSKFLKTYSLQNKVALVIGGGVGIGKGISVELARAGADIIIADINEEYANNVVDEIRVLGNRTAKFIGDVQKTEVVDRLMDFAVREMDNIDILVNSVGGLAGIKSAIPLWEMSEEQWDRILTLNTKPLFLCTKAFSRLLIERKKGGCIINLSSLVGIAPPSSLCITYGLAKAGIINFTTTAAVDLAKYRIRVNCIAPGRMMGTPSSIGLKDRYKGMRQAQISMIPLRRLGTPEEIGKVAVFLASEAADYITGVTISLSGGLTHLYTPSLETAQIMQSITHHNNI